MTDFMAQMFEHTCSSCERSQPYLWAGQRCPWKFRDVTITYEQSGLHLPDCFTGDLQPHTSEIITDPKNFLSPGLVLKSLIMLLLLLGDLLTFGKEAVSQVIYGCYK